MENRWIQNLLNKINNTGIPKGYRGYPIENIENALKENISDQMDAMIMPRFEYYEEGDVVYISFGKPLPCIRTEVEDILIGRTPDGKLNGITIVDYKKKITLVCS